MSEKNLNKVFLAEGETVFLQGEESESVFFAHKGEFEILTHPSKKNVIESDLSNSIKIASLASPCTLGEEECLLRTPRMVTVRALTQSELTAFAITGQEFEKLFGVKPAIGLQMAQNVFNRYRMLVSQLTELNALIKDLQILGDNLSLMYYDIKKETVSPKKGKSIFSKIAAAPKEEKEDKFFTHGRLLAENLPITGKENFKDGSFIEKNMNLFLNRNYGLPGLDKITLTKDELDFLSQLLVNTGNHFLEIISVNPNLCLYILKKFAVNTPQTIKLIVDSKEYIDNIFNYICGRNDNIFERLIEMKDDFSDEIRVKISTGINELHGNYMEILGMPFKEMSHRAANLTAQIIKNEAERQKEEEEEEVIEIKTELKNTLSQLMELPYIDQKIKSSFFMNLEKYQRLEDKLEVFGDARKIKKTAAKNYWNIYYEVIKNALIQKQLPFNLKMLLRCGLVDERMIDVKQLHYLSELKNEKTILPVYYADEWLARIFHGQEVSSKTELGLSFQEMREAAATGDFIYKTENPAYSELKYEIFEMIAVASRMVSQSLSHAFPVLDSALLQGDISDKILTKKKLEETVNEILKVDYSCFYREVRAVFGGKFDFYQKEILPNFIIVPASGKKAVCWQELDTRSKESRGRIILPLIYYGDLKEMLLDAFGRFRWELNRTIAGYNWGNPMEGGLTGKYFDYVCNYKKNTGLSTELKQQITEYFKKHTTTVDKFVRDYLLWTQYEKDGILKLNKIVREIFWFYVPFPKTIRNKLGKVPAYSQIYNRDNNLRVKKIKTIRNQIKKWDNAGLKVPPEILNKEKFYML